MMNVREKVISSGCNQNQSIDKIFIVNFELFFFLADMSEASYKMVRQIVERSDLDRDYFKKWIMI